MPPNNSAYMYAAYVVAAAIYALYALSLWRRRRRAQARLRQLEQADVQ
jgi:Flp pilus assembly protein TadB